MDISRPHLVPPSGNAMVARSSVWVLVALVAVVVLAAGARVAVGGVGDTPEQTWLLLEIRGLRVASATIVGASLAVAGVLLQGLLRNPLASPDLLGMSSGAGLGVMFAVYLGFLAGGRLADADAAIGLGGLGATAAATLGACVTLLVVYAASQRMVVGDQTPRSFWKLSGWHRAQLDPVTLVLVGVIVAIICSGAITLLKHLLPDQGVAANRLLVGALRDDVRPAHLWIGAALLVLALLIAGRDARAMDIASLSDDEASSLGVPLRRLRAVQFLVAGILTAGAVVLAGPIGFVGLLCPHVVRGWCGPRHGPLLLGAALLGAAVLILADLLVAGVRELHPGLGRLPLGALTAIVGGPIFLWWLRRPGAMANDGISRARP